MAITAYELGLSKNQQWDDFVASKSHDGGLGNIHQLAEWGIFQQQARGDGWKSWIVVVADGDKLIGGGLVMKRMMGMGKGWLYVPKGPIFDYEDSAADEVIVAWLKTVDELAKREKAVFLRVEPGLIENGPQNFGLKTDLDWKKYGFEQAHAHYQPEHTVIVDLRPEEGVILAQMKAKGRYNIKLAEKKGVQVVIAGESEITLEEGVKEFCRLLGETTTRDGFQGHTEAYYLAILKTMGREKVVLYLARFENEIIAGVIVTFYGELAIYYFGASGNKHRNLMAPYLLQWRAMQEAKRRGMKWYDFLGTAPLISDENGEFSYDNKHPWAGVTEFKLKFGGHKVDFYPGMEKVYDRMIYLMMVLKKKLHR